MNESVQLTPCAEWADDCLGKKDYDGPLLNISCRYYPGPDGGGTMTYDTATEQFGTVAYGPYPTAIASIELRHGIPDDGDYKVWREKEFVGHTEEEVKASVEAWVAEQFLEVQRLLGMLKE